jgi:hypothetical protein
MTAKGAQLDVHHPHTEDARHTAHARSQTGQLIIFKGRKHKMPNWVRTILIQKMPGILLMHVPKQVS